MIERKFIEDRMAKLKILEFLKSELDRAGYSYADIQRTPLGTRVIVHTSRPGRVIGRKGQNIEELTRVLKEKFKLENPIIEVQEIKKPELDPRLMAEFIARGLERGLSFKRIAHIALRRIEEAGAKGAQIRISGKVISQRKSSWLFQFGEIKYTGEEAKRKVREAFVYADTKPGILGVKVKIVPGKEEDEGERAEKTE